MKLIYFTKNKAVIINIAIYILIFYFVVHSNIVLKSITNSIDLFIYKLLPALFPYVLITEVLINSNLVYNLSYGLSNIISKLFRIPPHTAPAVIIGFLLGYPNSAKFILKQYESHQIDSKLSTKLIAFTSNANISYIFAAVGIGLFNSMKIGLILTISHFLASVIVGITLTPSYNNSIIQQTKTNSNSFKKIYSPFELLSQSILGSLKTFAYIFSYTVIFSLIPQVMFSDLKLPSIITAVITGIFEISNGMQKIALLNVNFTLKLTLSSFVLSFSSLMIQMQIFTFASQAKVEFKDLFKYKTIQGTLSCMITYILTNFFYFKSLPAFINNDKYTNSFNIFPSTIYMLSIIITLILCILLFRKKRQVKPVA